jgi:hypothetical protein
VIEICGGLLLVVGLLTRLTASALAAGMLGAIVVPGAGALGARESAPGADAAGRDDHPDPVRAGDWSLGRHLAANMSRRCAAFLLILSGCPSLETGDSRASSSTSDR